MLGEEKPGEEPLHDAERECCGDAGRNRAEPLPSAPRARGHPVDDAVDDQRRHR